MRIVLTGCAVGLPDPPGRARADLPSERLPGATDADDLAETARAGHKAPAGRDPASPATPRSSATPRAPAARPRAPPTRTATSCYNAERRRQARPARGAGLLRAGAAVPHHRHGLRVRRLPEQHVGTLVLAYRFPRSGCRAGRLRRAPARTTRSAPSTCLHGAGRHPSITRRALPPRFAGISSGGAPTAARSGRAVPRAGFRPVHPQRLRTHRVHPSLRLRTRPTWRRPSTPVSGTLAVGVPGPETVVRIVDEQGAEVPFGEQGRDRRQRSGGRPRLLAAPTVPPPGHSPPAASCAPSDIGFMDAQGWLYVVDRKKDVIGTSGFKVWPREVEGCPLHPPGGARGRRRRRARRGTAGRPSRRTSASVGCRDGPGRARRILRGELPPTNTASGGDPARVAEDGEWEDPPSGTAVPVGTADGRVKTDEVKNGKGR